jgi:hypothetical protein
MRLLPPVPSLIFKGMKKLRRQTVKQLIGLQRNLEETGSFI